MAYGDINEYTRLKCEEECEQRSLAETCACRDAFMKKPYIGPKDSMQLIGHVKMFTDLIEF